VFSKFPPLKWAQTAEALLVTLDLADCENIICDVDEAGSKILFR